MQFFKKSAVFRKSAVSRNVPTWRTSSFNLEEELKNSCQPNPRHLARVGSGVHTVFQSLLKVSESLLKNHQNARKKNSFQENFAAFGEKCSFQDNADLRTQLKNYASELPRPIFFMPRRSCVRPRDFMQKS